METQKIKALDIIREHVERCQIARSMEEERRAIKFAREALLEAPKDLEGVLPPEFIWKSAEACFFNSNFIEIQPYKPYCAKFVIHTLDDLDLYVKRVGSTYQLVTFKRCPRCGENVEITISTPEDLLTVIEGGIPSGTPHLCKGLDEDSDEEAFWRYVAEKISPYLREVIE